MGSGRRDNRQSRIADSTGCRSSERVGLLWNIKARLEGGTLVDCIGNS